MTSTPNPQFGVPAADIDSVTSLLDSLIDDLPADHVSTVALSELRASRDRCQSVEEGLSFARRMVQGRLDIALGEVERRSAGESGAVVDRLADVLSKGMTSKTSPSTPRPVPERALPSFTETISDEIDRILGVGDLRDLQVLTDDALNRAVASLDALEREVSEHRRRVHSAIDALQAELVDRYRSGRASVDDLLSM